MKKNIARCGFHSGCLATLAAHAQNLESVLNSMDKAAADFQHRANRIRLGPVREGRGRARFAEGHHVLPAPGRRSADGGRHHRARQEVRAVQRRHGQRVRAQSRAGHGIQRRQEQGRLRDLPGAGIWRTRPRPGQVVRREVCRDGAGAGHQRRQAGADAEIAEGRQHVPDDHALDRSGARGQRAAAIYREVRGLPAGEVQQHSS